MCPDRPRAALAILAALLTMVLPSAAGQLAAIAVAGLLGWWTLKIAQPGGGHAHSYPVSRKLGIVALLLFAAPLVGLPLWAAATDSSTIALLEGVYRPVHWSSAVDTLCCRCCRPRWCPAAS